MMKTAQAVFIFPDIVLSLATRYYLRIKKGKFCFGKSCFGWPIKLLMDVLEMEIVYRDAVFDDVESLHKLLNDYAAEGLMLSRSRNGIYENIRDYIVAVEGGRVVGVGALHMVWDRLAEIRSLAVVQGYQKKSIGRELVRKLEVEGKRLGVETFFTLTYQPGFFAKCGYTEVPNNSLPQKVWKECVHCPKYPYCDETAMVKKMEEVSGCAGG